MARAPSNEGGGRPDKGAAAPSSTKPTPAGAHDIDRVIHEPARLQIVALLRAVGEADFVVLQRKTGLTGGNLSTHVRRLERAGYVLVKKGFADKRPRTTLSLTRAGQNAFVRYRLTLDSLLHDLCDELAR